MSFQNLSGQKFGRLTVTDSFRIVSGRFYWDCKCECGNSKLVAALHLKANRIRSCGCLAREMTSKRNTIHGHSKRGEWHRLYGVWFRMIGRCKNPKDPKWKDYGGRGITVCERWKDINNFIADMDGYFSHGLEIERINNDGEYSPVNCRWATRREQMLNTRRSRKININGVVKNITEWCDQLGVKIETFYWRVNRGMSDVEALLKPLQPGRKL